MILKFLTLVILSSTLSVVLTVPVEELVENRLPEEDFQISIKKPQNITPTSLVNQSYEILKNLSAPLNLECKPRVYIVKKEIEKLKNQLDEEKKVIDTVQKSLQNETEKVIKLQSQLQEERKKIKDLNDELIKVNTSNVQLALESQNLLDQLNNTEQAKNILEKYYQKEKDKVTGLKLQFQEKSQELEDSIYELKKSNVLLTLETQNLTDQLNKTEQAKNNTEKDFKKEKEKMSAITLQLQEKSQKLEDSMKELKKLNASNVQLTLETKNLTEQLNKTNEAKTTLEKDLQKEKEKVGELKLQFQEMSQELQGSKNEVNRLHASNVALEQKIQKLDSSRKLQICEKDTTTELKLFITPKTWDEARKCCQNQDMDLAVINSKNEERWMKEELLKFKNKKVQGASNNWKAWIGLRYETNRWLTVAGEPTELEPVQWTDLSKHFSGRHCGSLYGDGTVYGNRCHYKFAFFCRKNV